jgi:hypothetical protein
MFTKSRQWIMFWSIRIQSTPSHSLIWSILVSCHLALVLQAVSSFEFSYKNFVRISHLSHTCCVLCPYFRLHFEVLTIFYEYKLTKLLIMQFLWTSCYVLFTLVQTDFKPSDKSKKYLQTSHRLCDTGRTAFYQLPASFRVSFLNNVTAVFSKHTPYLPLSLWVI